jgi:hypothetical protein
MQVVLVTALLRAGRGPASALVVAYPLLVVGSALSASSTWIVWYSASLAAVGYGVTVLAGGLQPDEQVPSSVSLTFVAMLLLLALMQSLLLRGPGRH